MRSGFCKLAFDERAAVNSVLLVVETSMKKRRKKTQDICGLQEVGSNRRTKLVGLCDGVSPYKLMTREMGGIVC